MTFSVKLPVDHSNKCSCDFNSLWHCVEYDESIKKMRNLMAFEDFSRNAVNSLGDDSVSCGLHRDLCNPEWHLTDHPQLLTFFQKSVLECSES